MSSKDSIKDVLAGGFIKATEDVVKDRNILLGIQRSCKSLTGVSRVWYGR